MTEQSAGLWIHGISGRMGEELATLLAENAGAGCFHLLGGSSQKARLEDQLVKVRGSQHFIDFSTPEANKELLEFFVSSGLREKSVLIGTTGLTAELVERWQEVALQARLAILFAPNTSLGILLALKSAMLIAGICHGEDFDIEITETHHRHKKDAPSGTARFLAAGLQQAVADLRPVTARAGARQRGEIGLHSLRGGGVFGEHAIRFLSQHEEITISHRAFSRRLFVQGALTLSRWLLRQEPGTYSLFDIDCRDLA